MSGWPLRKSFNKSQSKENAVMTCHEKWVHEKNLDEIVDRLSQLLVSILLLSVQQINEQYLPLKKQLESKQTEDIRF
jgi:thiamine kinase-like enzyme